MSSRDTDPSVKPLVDQKPDIEQNEVKANIETAGVVDVERLGEEISRLKQEIVALRTQLESLHQRQKEELSSLMDLWKKGTITSKERFAELSSKVQLPCQQVDNEIINKMKERRIARIELLSNTIPPDNLRQRVLDLDIKSRVKEFENEDIQAGGSRAMGVFDIEDGEFVLIKKSGGTYEYDGALPYLMQDIENERVPRVLDVFEAEGSTYKVMEKAVGVQLDGLTDDQLEVIPQEHFDQFIKDILILDKKSLIIDPSKRSNFFYDSEVGFSFIDLGDSGAVSIEGDKTDMATLDNLIVVLGGEQKNKKLLDKLEMALRNAGKY